MILGSLQGFCAKHVGCTNYHQTGGNSHNSVQRLAFVDLKESKPSKQKSIQLPWQKDKVLCGGAETAPGLSRDNQSCSAGWFGHACRCAGASGGGCWDQFCMFHWVMRCLSLHWNAEDLEEKSDSEPLD